MINLTQLSIALNIAPLSVEINGHKLAETTATETIILLAATGHPKAQKLIKDALRPQINPALAPQSHLDRSIYQNKVKEISPKIAEIQAELEKAQKSLVASTELQNSGSMDVNFAGQNAAHIQRTRHQIKSQTTTLNGLLAELEKANACLADIEANQTNELTILINLLS